MSDPSPIPPLDVRFDVAAALEHAFEVFVARPKLWWPPGHTFSGGPAAIVIEPHVGGRIFERARSGEEFDWGEVVHWESPHKVGFLWHLFFPRAEATLVEVSFTATAAGTQVHLRQSGWENLGDQGPPRRERTALGWAAVTQPYRDSFNSQGKGSPMADEPISSGSGTAQDPWLLKTPPLSSGYTMHRDTRDGVDVIVCTVGKTVLLYDARCLDDLHAMLTAHGDWLELGSADEQKPAKDGTVEGWGRSESNPVGGWYGLKKGLRGRFGMYIPPLMEHLGRAEVEHNARGNRMRAI